MRPTVLSESITTLWSKGLTGRDDVVIPASPDARYRYLRVEVQGRPPALLVLGYLDSNPAGYVETWYSANREVLKTQNGRIVGTAGLEVDWIAVRYVQPPPVWSLIGPEGASFQRERDQMPGYAYGLQDSVNVTPLVATPVEQVPASMPMARANSYRWFKEIAHTGTGSQLPPAWFAWGVHRGVNTIVYSEQCLSPSFCLKLQRWPVAEAAP